MEEKEGGGREVLGGKRGMKRTGKETWKRQQRGEEMGSKRRRRRAGSGTKV